MTLAKRGAERHLLFLFCAAHALTHLSLLVLPASFTQLEREFGWSVETLGLVNTGMQLAFGFLAIPVGYFAVRIGAVRLLGMGFFVMALGTSVSAVTSPALPIFFSAGVYLLGAGASVFHPVGFGDLSERVSDKARAFSLLGVAGSIGVGVAHLFLGNLADYAGWRVAFGVVAVANALMAVAFFYSLPKSQKSLPKWQLKEVHARPLSLTLSHEGRGDDKRASEGILNVRVLLLLLIAFLLGAIYHGYVTFLKELNQTVFSEGRWHLPLLWVNNFSSLALLMGVGGQWSVAYLGKRFRPELCMASLVVVMVAILLAMGMSTERPGLYLALSLLFPLVYFTGQPLGHLLVAHHVPPAKRSRVYGMYFAASFGVGAVGSSGGAFALTRYGMGALFVLLAVLGLGMALSALALYVLDGEKGARNTA